MIGQTVHVVGFRDTRGRSWQQLHADGDRADEAFMATVRAWFGNWVNDEDDLEQLADQGLLDSYWHHTMRVQP